MCRAREEIVYMKVINKKLVKISELFLCISSISLSGLINSVQPIE